MLTGGGTADTKEDKSDDVLLSILNKKTVVGLENMFDDDAHFVIGDTSLSKEHDRGIIIELEENLQDEDPCLMIEDPDTLNVENIASGRNNIFVKNVGKNTASTSRPRSTIVKALTTSSLAQKYEELVTKRLEISNSQQMHILQEIKFAEQKQKLELELLRCNPINMNYEDEQKRLQRLWDKIRALPVELSDESDVSPEEDNLETLIDNSDIEQDASDSEDLNMQPLLAQKMQEPCL
ncbi:hypothetical protein FQR65_LT17247 [Abscondita terminalis]|nr:hypothetical protein FQR65_LT17479 [Abscondita terminalis]KAF5273144.1 hypothetical protein FQR65_LT17247 [Abscondita terminalis]